MPTFTMDDDAPILVEFAPRAPQPGLQETMRGWPSAPVGDIAEQSAKALNTAMNTIHNMARRVSDTIKALPMAERPSQIEVEFGLKLDAAAGAVIAQAGTEASFTVKLMWERREPKRGLRPPRARR